MYLSHIDKSCRHNFVSFFVSNKTNLISREIGSRLVTFGKGVTDSLGSKLKQMLNVAEIEHYMVVISTNGASI